MAEARFAMLARTDPARAEQLFTLAQADVDERWRYYEQLAGLDRAVPSDAPDEEALVDDTGTPVALGAQEPASGESGSDQSGGEA